MKSNLLFIFWNASNKSLDIILSSNFDNNWLRLLILKKFRKELKYDFNLDNSKDFINCQISDLVNELDKTED